MHAQAAQRSVIALAGSCSLKGHVPRHVKLNILLLQRSHPTYSVVPGMAGTASAPNYPAINTQRASALACSPWFHTPLSPRRCTLPLAFCVPPFPCPRHLPSVTVRGERLPFFQVFDFIDLRSIMECEAPPPTNVDEALADLSVRFLANLPVKEPPTVERLFFQIQQAHW